MRRPTMVLVGTLACAAGCDEQGAEPETTQLRQLPLSDGLAPVAIPVPGDAVCSIKVANHGTKSMEDDYLPNVLACEAPGTADLETLRAQAIAARSYVYYFAETSGSICNGQGCQVYSCGRTPSQLHRQAVRDTSGVVLAYDDVLTIGFYVAGDKTPDASCVGNSGGVGDTEKWVTYNEGKTETNVTQTKLGWRHQPSDTDYGQNRGALSQWGSHCLEQNHGYTAVDILRFFYGDDIGVQQVPGSCVEPIDTDFDPERPVCGRLDPAGPTIIDNGDSCFELAGPAKYWRSEEAGHGGSLRWTKSTQTTEHNVATWRLEPEVSGPYRIEVHIDAAHTTADIARYEVIDAHHAEELTIDQTVGGWIELGVFELSVDAVDQQVRMPDLIGVADLVLQADALRATPIDPSECGPEGCKTDELPGGTDLERGGESATCRVEPSSPRSGAGWLLIALASLTLRRPRARHR